MSSSQAIEIANETPGTTWRSRKLVKMVALYFTMVCVSTIAIYFLEHSSLLNAFRTALVAAVGKTVAANWVSGIFD
jgi:hypothetical protein